MASFRTYHVLDLRIQLQAVFLRIVTTDKKCTAVLGHHIHCTMRLYPLCKNITITTVAKQTTTKPDWKTNNAELPHNVNFGLNKSDTSSLINKLLLII